MILFLDFGWWRVSGEREVTAYSLGKTRSCCLMGHHIYIYFFFSRYASLYFCCAIENQDNELLTLEIVHRYVELLDKYFGNVSVWSIQIHGSPFQLLRWFFPSLKSKIRIAFVPRIQIQDFPYFL